VIDIIREAAVRDVLPRFQRLARHEVMEKKPGDLVTIADIDAEHRLARRLSELVPGSCVVGEEAAAKDADLLDHLDGGGPLWLIDPVDGTRNFADGRTPFTMVIAYVEDGAVRVGWIHEPVANETAVAIEGGGAWYRGQRLRVAAPSALENMIGMINVTAFGRQLGDRVRARADRFREVRNWRCAGHDFLLLACGEKHFSLYRRLWPWDHAAGVLMHREAGGYGARIDGKRYRPTDRVEGLLLAPDAESWERIRAYLSQEVRP
jgi:fructose-1,6-bisphosphatase/inositol monophosphatase family enzyme